MDRMVRKHKQQIKKDLLLKKKNGFIANLNAHLPLFILSDDRRSFFSWAIKAHSHGNYSHFFTMVHPNKVATQGLLFNEVPIEKYMRDGIILKVWYYPDMPEEMSIKIRGLIEAKLKQAWWTRLYDGVGIIGQALGKRLKWLRVINIPGLNYCTEYTKCIKVMFPDFNIFEPNPAEINAFFNTKAFFKTKKEMKVLCRWNVD